MLSIMIALHATIHLAMFALSLVKCNPLFISKHLLTCVHVYYQYYELYYVTERIRYN